MSLLPVLGQSLSFAGRTLNDLRRHRRQLAVDAVQDLVHDHRQVGLHLPPDGAHALLELPHLATRLKGTGSFRPCPRTACTSAEARSHIFSFF